MTQAIASRTSSSIEAPRVDIATSRELAARKNMMVEGRLLEPLPPAVVAQLKQRQAVVMGALQSGSRSDLEEVVAGLMTGYPSMRNLSKLEAQILVRKYADDLVGIPLWAIRAGCQDISRGKVSDLNPDFPPSASRVRQQADEHLERFTREARDLRLVLSAPVEPPADPEMAARINLGFLKLRGKYAKPYVPEPEAPPSKTMKPEQLEAHYAKHGIGFQKKQ